MKTVCLSLKSHSMSSLTHSHTFLYTFFLTPAPSTSPSSVPPQGGCCFRRLLEQSSLTMEGPSLSPKSPKQTPTVLLSRRGSLDTDADDLATTLYASDVCDMTDVGRLTSPSFSLPFGVSCSQVHSSTEKSRRVRETVVERKKKSRFRECAGFPNGK